jgi:hypothetical protein
MMPAKSMVSFRMGGMSATRAQVGVVVTASEFAG